MIPNKTTFRLCLLVLQAAAFCGCNRIFPKVGPDYRLPDVTVPSGWTTTTSAVAGERPGIEYDTARWWRQLGDTQLDQLIEDALAGNLDLRSAKARLQQARASRDQAEAELYPTLNVSGSANRREVSSSSSGTQAAGAANIGAGIGSGGIGSTVNGSTYAPGLDASWEIDLFGGIRRGIEAATADEAASAANLNNARVSLVAEVARNYIEMRSYQRRIIIANNNLASQSDTAQITEWRYLAGLATASELEQAKTNREQTRAGIPDLEESLTAAENRLAVLLGRNPGSLRERLAEAKALPVLPTAIATGIPADVLRQRPDLIAAERTLAAETARVGQKLAKRFPSLNLNASLNWYTFASAGMSTVIQTIGASLGATLFDAGRLRAAVDIQNAVQEQALLNYQNSVLTALEEVENALKAYAAGHERVGARRAAAESAFNAAQLARQLYQSGLADFQSVLDSERTRLSAEDNLASAEAGLIIRLISLYKALGGGWQEKTAVQSAQGSGT